MMFPKHWQWRCTITITTYSKSPLSKYFGLTVKARPGLYTCGALMHLIRVLVILISHEAHWMTPMSLTVVALCYCIPATQQTFTLQSLSISLFILMSVYDILSITCHTCLPRCCPCSRCRLRSSGRTRQRVRYTGRVGSWGSPSDPPDICRTADRKLRGGTDSDRWTCHTAESQNLPDCNHRLDGGREKEKEGSRKRRGEGIK